MAAVRHRHHIHAPTWIAIGSTPPAPSRDAACRKLAAYSPLLLPPPSVWRKDERRNDDDVGGGVLPASPRISCMGQVKGGRGCASARGTAARGAGADYYAGGGGGSLAGLVMELFGRRRRRRGKGKKSRACSRVRDVPSDSSSSSSRGSTWGARAPAQVCLLDQPLPVVMPPARDDYAPSLWERRRGGGKPLYGLVLAPV